MQFTQAIADATMYAKAERQVIARTRAIDGEIIGPLENVFAAEVEAPLLALSEVLECAVIGVPDEQWGEAIKSIEFWEAIPKTSVGKTDKKAIRKHFA